MIVPFSNLAPGSRIWIFQSSRELNEADQATISTATATFLKQWTAHGASLEAAMEIVYGYFLIIGVNENVNEASGCSIDRAMGYVSQLGERLGVRFLDRSLVAYRQNGKIGVMDFKDIKEALGKGKLSESTEIFNNAVTTKQELQTVWIQPVADSWLGKYILKK